MAEQKKLVQEPDLEEQRESGMSWMIVGGMLWAFAFLVMFFHPAAYKLGQMNIAVIASVLCVLGIISFLAGVRIRVKAR